MDIMHLKIKNCGHYLNFFLNENVRQMDDTEYANLLNRARVGLLSNDDVKRLSSRIIHPLPIDPTSILHLFPTNKQVKSHNAKIQKK